MAAESFDTTSNWDKLSFNDGIVSVLGMIIIFQIYSINNWERVERGGRGEKWGGRKGRGRKRAERGREKRGREKDNPLYPS